MTLQKLNKQYDDSCNAFCELFAKKHGIIFDGWVGGIIGEIASFSDQYFFNISDVILELNTSQPKGHILEWHDKSSHSAFCGERHINYRSYVKGLRY